MTTSLRSNPTDLPPIPSACLPRPLDAVAAIRDVANDRFSMRSAVGIRRYEPRQMIFEQSQPCRHIFEIIEGTVKLTIALPDGRRQILAVLGPGDLLGLPLGQQHNTSAIAISDVRVKQIARSVFDASLLLQSRAAAQLQKLFLKMQDMIVSLGRRSATERIASYILETAKSGNSDAATPNQPTWSFTLALSQTDLADHLGLTLETVSRELTKLKNHKIIRMSGRNHLEVLDPSGLSEFADNVSHPQTAPNCGTTNEAPEPVFVGRRRRAAR
ncbi:MAG: Crp/Fnr family transcriptional regulator [Hyphomicrobium sp.]|nr:Crp/Fnr family transcriptional regulator [Hyphomicrobium sp.]